MNLTPSVDGSENGSSANGHSHAPVAPADLRWQVSYDRVSVDRFVAEVEAEQARLREAIAAARDRVVRAKEAGNQARVRPELSALLQAAQRELAELEREHRAILKAISTAAIEEATRLLTAARDEVTAARGIATSVAGSDVGEISVDDLLRDIDLQVARSVGERIA